MNAAPLHVMFPATQVAAVLLPPTKQNICVVLVSAITAKLKEINANKLKAGSNAT